MSQQNWTPVLGYEGLYEINRQAEVRSLHKRNFNRIIQPRIDRAGYRTIRLSKEDKSTTHSIHRLIALTYIPNPDSKGYVNHKNGNKLDNSIDNLEWVTHQENVIDAYKQGLNSAAKRIIDTVTGVVYTSITEAANALGINYNTCCKRLQRNLPTFRLRYIG